MEDHGLLKEGIASSHAIECLLFNVPNQKFGDSYQDTFVNIVNWLSEANLANFVCQNSIQPLFDDGRWTIQKAHAYINALVQMWQQWG